MPILNIEPATRKGAHLLIQCFGGPRSGKTRTALRLARGIVGPKGSIGVLDTEAGRARLHADKVPGGFVVGELTPPFTPQRYIEAIEEFVRAGVDILVIDSFSHVWEGEGGVLEQADQAEQNGKKAMQKWLQPKKDYKRLVNFLLSTRLHIILCSRAKQPIVEGYTPDGKKTLVTLPWEPIQDKRLKYEMTIVLPMTLDGAYETDPMRLKAPDDLSGLFTGALLTEKTGAAIARWVSGGEAVDSEFELFRKEAREVASMGTEKFRLWWRSVPENMLLYRAILKQRELGNLESIAAAGDEEIARQKQAEEEAWQREADEDKLDDPFARRAPLNEAGPNGHRAAGRA